MFIQVKRARMIAIGTECVKKKGTEEQKHQRHYKDSESPRDLWNRKRRQRRWNED